MVREIVADAYIDWMHESFRDGDDSRYDTIVERPDQADNPRWVRLADQVERYRHMSIDQNIDTDGLAELRRKIVANMVRIFEEAEA